MLTSGFQLLTEVSDDLLRMIAGNDDAQYALLSQVGIRSMMVVPVVARGRLVAILDLVYTNESRRRFGRDELALAEELAVHAAHLEENARLLKELRASEARFGVALAGARTTVFEQDARLRYVWYHTPQASSASYVGKSHEELVPPNEAATLTALKSRVLQTGEPWFGELELTLGGTKRWYREAIEPARDRLGRDIGVIGAATDITEQKQTQNELKTALDFRDRVMGVLGHDLRNPLGAITMSMQKILRLEDLPETARASAGVVARAAKRMDEMIERLLTFTRARFTGQPFAIARTPCDLRGTLREVVDELRAAWPGRAVELEASGDAQGSWDCARIAEAVSNLAANALSYGDPKTPVRIAIEGEPKEVVVRVHNEGSPIPESLQRSLFEPFVRGAREDVSPHGLGLGLYVVDEIVKAHGGTVDVRSTAQEGTTFTIRVPRA
jgi:signal transduction histidine kinase